MLLLKSEHSTAGTQGGEGVVLTKEGEGGQKSIHRGGVIERGLIWFVLMSLLSVVYSWEADTED